MDCPRCGLPLAPTETACPRCGRPAQQAPTAAGPPNASGAMGAGPAASAPVYKVCPTCGEPAAVLADKCNRCGLVLPFPSDYGTQAPEYEVYPGHPGYAVSRGSVAGLIAGSLALSLASIFFCTHFIGAGAFVLGYQVRRRGQTTTGTVLMVLSVVCMAAGTVLRYVSWLSPLFRLIGL